MESTEKIVITAGGTGGHMIPAQAFADILREQGKNVFFVGGKLDENPYFDRGRYPFEAISCSTLSWRSPLKVVTGMIQILRGFIKARTVLKRERPSFVVGFGSYHTLPVLLAARSLKIPIILHEGNSIPGRVNRFASSFATMTGVHFPEALQHLKGAVEPVPLPLRKGKEVSTAEARRHFGLKEEAKTLLVVGGSQGAQALNYAVPKALDKGWQVLHLAGDEAATNALKREYACLGITHCVLPFTEEMAIAWQAADIAVTRGGAGTLAEMELYGVPGIIIPYPRALDNHQWHNANYLEKVGGAVILLQKDLSPQGLKQRIEAVSGQQGQMRSLLLKHSQQRQARALQNFLKREA